MLQLGTEFSLLPQRRAAVKHFSGDNVPNWVYEHEEVTCSRVILLSRRELFLRTMVAVSGFSELEPGSSQRDGLHGSNRRTQFQNIANFSCRCQGIG